jgi:hypothetical protein
VAFGPTLGGLVGRLLGNPYSVFYLALGMHAINVLFSWFVVPESLLPAQMDAARRARGGSKGRWFSWVFNFLAPLAVLAPLPQKGSVTPQRALKKDWSLTWLALSFAPESLVFGGMQYWLQYAAGKFNWTGEIVSATRNESTWLILTTTGRILHKHNRNHPGSFLGHWAARLAKPKPNIYFCS